MQGVVYLREGLFLKVKMAKKIKIAMRDSLLMNCERCLVVACKLVIIEVFFPKVCITIESCCGIREQLSN